MSSRVDASRTLWVLRHAKAAQPPGPGAEADRDRPLTASGTRQADALGRLLADPRGRAGSGIPFSGPELVLCSTARRCRETAEHVVRRLDPMPEVRHLHMLYGAQPADVIEVLGTVGDAVPSVLVVGHNPTAGVLGTIGRGAGSTAHFPTCTLSVVDLGDSSWSETDPRRWSIIARVQPPYPDTRPHHLGQST